MSIKTFSIILYISLMLLIYILTIKRLKFLNNKHLKLIWVNNIKTWFNIIKKIIFVLLLINTIFSVILILTLL